MSSVILEYLSKQQVLYHTSEVKYLSEVSLLYVMFSLVRLAKVLIFFRSAPSMSNNINSGIAISSGDVKSIEIYINRKNNFLKSRIVPYPLSWSKLTSITIISLIIVQFWPRHINLVIYRTAHAHIIRTINC